MTPPTTEEAVADLRPSARLVLKVLAEVEDGPLAPSTISERAVDLPQSTTSDALMALLAAGLVERVAPHDDLRSTRYRLTDDGEAAVR